MIEWLPYYYNLMMRISFIKFPRKKITSWACLLRSTLKLFFHLNVYLYIIFKSSFKFFANKVVSWAIEKREVSSTKSVGFEIKLSQSLLINTKK